MHEMPNAAHLPASVDASAPPDASGAHVPAAVPAPDGAEPAQPPALPALPLPLSWVAAQRAAAFPRPWPSAVWPRAWSSVGAWLAALVLLVVVVLPQPPSVTALYDAAAHARASWRYDRALAFYARAAQDDPADPRAHCLAGEVLALQQLYDQAVAAYTTCQRLGGSAGAIGLAQGDIAQARGDGAGAERAWLRAAALGSVTAHTRLGPYYEAAAEFDQARAQWLALPADDAEARIHLGLLALRVGDYPTARAEFVAARALPGFAAQGVVDQGFVQLAAFGPTDPAGLTAIGSAFIQAGMPAFARLPLQQALALSPASGPALADLAWVERLAGETTAAQRDSASALALIPHDAFALFVAAELALDAGQWSAAVGLLDRAVQTGGTNGELWAERGRAEVELHNYVQAELSYQRAGQTGTNPAFGQLYLDFYVRFQLGLDDGRALAAVLATTARWPTDAGVWELAGQIDELAGQVGQAQDAYQRANQLDPSLPRPYLDLGRLADQSQQYVAAAIDLRTGLALQPDGPLASQFQRLLVVLEDFDV